MSHRRLQTQDDIAAKARRLLPELQGLIVGRIDLDVTEEGVTGAGIWRVVLAFTNGTTLEIQRGEVREDEHQLTVTLELNAKR